jgi:hypothetical protein
MRAELEDRQEIRMIERSGGSGFLFEASTANPISIEMRREKFDRDLATEPRVECAIDLPHPTGANRFDDLVASDQLSGFETHTAIVRFFVFIRPRRPSAHAAALATLRPRRRRPR